MPPSIMDMFRTPTIPNAAASVNPHAPAAQSPSAAANGNQNPTAPVTAASPGTDANGVIPADGTNGAPKAPLADFATLFDPTPVVKDAQGNVIPPTNNSSYLTIDNKKIMDAAKLTDFSKAVSPELITRMRAGGEDGAAAMVEALNTVGQAAYGQASIAGARLTEGALQKAQERFVASLPDIIKRVQASDSLRAEDPRMNNPAVKPLIDMVQTQLAAKNPTATSAELNKLAKQYVTDFAGAFAPPVAESVVAKTGNSTDWSKFLE